MSHDNIASTFDAWASDGRAAGLEQGHGDVVRQVIAAMEIKPGQQTLDMGCGNGWGTRLLGQAAPGAGAVGIDVSKGMIAEAESLHDYTYRARYEHGSFEALDFKDGKFDRVFSMEAIYYAVDLDKSLSEMHRVLKSGGAADIVIDCFEESEHTAGWPESCGLPMHRLTEADWKNRFEAAGFANVSMKRVIDSRGVGVEADFTPSVHCPDWKTRVELHEAGSLWIHAERA
ncbi:MAG: ubiquinone/menaquinone biosynthesis C-methylase UbiE [Planctomycetota bacterium]|jgi:ubiquinone/menaquinone biosynthesis C-methylase UbiE